MDRNGSDLPQVKQIRAHAYSLSDRQQVLLLIVLDPRASRLHLQRGGGGLLCCRLDEMRKQLRLLQQVLKSVGPVSKLDTQEDILVNISNNSGEPGSKEVNSKKVPYHFLLITRSKILCGRRSILSIGPCFRRGLLSSLWRIGLLLRRKTVNILVYWKSSKQQQQTETDKTNCTPLLPLWSVKKDYFKVFGSRCFCHCSEGPSLDWGSRTNSSTWWTVRPFNEAHFSSLSVLRNTPICQDEILLPIKFWRATFCV